MAETIYNSIHTGQQIDEAVSWLQKHAQDQICGGAVSGTTIAVPDNPTYWFAPAGTYTCGSETITISSGNLGIISYDGSQWSSISFYVGATDIVNDFSGGVTKALSAEMGKMLNEGVTKDGLSFSEFDHSTFTAQTPNITLANAIVLAQVGDYIEIKVQANGTAPFLRHTASYNQPQVRYSSSNYLYIRFVYDITPFTYQGNEVDNTKVQVIKILLDSLPGTTYTFKVYVDGNLVGSPSVDTSRTIQYSQIGYNSTMDLYYIKGKSNGVDFDFSKFAQFTGATGVTDVYDTTNVPSLSALDTRVLTLEEQAAQLVGSDMFYFFKKESTVFNAESHFAIFQRLHGNVYLRSVIILYSPTESTNPKGYWRMERSHIGTLVDGVFTTIQDQVLTTGENEFVLKWLGGAEYNYSGGYSGGFHLGEKIGDEGTFVDFVADGNIVDLSADIPLTPCKSFYYKELSAIYQNVDDNIACYHYKETHFGNGGYEVRNEIKLTQALDYFAYFGIVCVGRNVSEYAMTENTPTATDMGDGSTTIAEQFKSNHHRIHYEGNGYGVDVESKLLYGDDDSLNSLTVYNSSSYNKFYRRTQDIAGSTLNRACGVTKVKFYKL